MGELSLHDAIYSLRAMRRLKPDPVPESELRELVDAATQAASGANDQGWGFVVITDREQRRRVAEVYRRLGHELVRDQSLASGLLSDAQTRVYRHAMVLVERMANVPAMILACARGPAPTSPLEASTHYGSIYPAIQNLMLAARARGLGTTLTTLHKASENEIKAILEIPDDVDTVALIPIGYPEGRFGRPKRRPSRDVTHWDRWGQPEPKG